MFDKLEIYKFTHFLRYTCELFTEFEIPKISFIKLPAVHLRDGDFVENHVQKMKRDQHLLPIAIQS